MKRKPKEGFIIKNNYLDLINSLIINTSLFIAELTNWLNLAAQTKYL